MEFNFFYIVYFLWIDFFSKYNYWIYPFKENLKKGPLNIISQKTVNSFQNINLLVIGNNDGQRVPRDRWGVQWSSPSWRSHTLKCIPFIRSYMDVLYVTIWKEIVRGVTRVDTPPLRQEFSTVRPGPVLIEYARRCVITRPPARYRDFCPAPTLANPFQPVNESSVAHPLRWQRKTSSATTRYEIPPRVMYA